ncbi:hypothetical protein HYFRA_00009044 [Hymenoscyphus fraxineus]|uniref:Protection of telomeres protein 1 ssDNA-binding domain-containing protein n=1 Tax=Hymenoscyphus fraxineus TaxID=746836 RepID=A0A9N9KRY3_9HELO|nr:hypothetical protein HYFRA_00009044 [Hymenoscyphus fraxineus]
MAPLLPPRGFNTISDVCHTRGGMEEGRFANIIGVVKDFMPPQRTRGTVVDMYVRCKMYDYARRIIGRGTRTHHLVPDRVDAYLRGYFCWRHNAISTSQGWSSISARVFGRSLNAAIAIQIQQRYGTISLLSNKSSEFHILPSSKVSLGQVVLQDRTHWRKFALPPTGNTKKVFKHPSLPEIAYAIQCHGHSIKEIHIPAKQDIDHKTLQTTNIRDKFTLLKDVRMVSEKPYYDIIGVVIRKHHDGNNCTTIHFSDYTANSLFYDRLPTDGDDQAWKGPLGKMSMQVSMWDQNARYMENPEIKEGSWVRLENVKIGYNPNETNSKYQGALEGKMRTDGNKVRVQFLDPFDRNMDPRLKEAIKRKRDYHLKQKLEIGSNERKREANEAPEGEPTGKLNSKARRKEERKQQFAEERQKLNESVRCNQKDRPVTSFADITKSVEILSGPDSENPPAPFTNFKYKACVRVVDYFPDRIEDFAHGVSEYDALSDNDESRDIEGDVQAWEWGFALQVEDASTKHQPKRIWLMVNNTNAQCLLSNLKNATDLRKDKKLLTGLKEKLWQLWGDLEEKKSALLKSQGKIPPSPKQTSRPPSPIPNADDEKADFSFVQPTTEKPSPAGRDPNAPSAILKKCIDNEDTAGLAPKNKPFECVILQYGIEFPESDEGMMDARPGFRWRRMFGLCETLIV